MKNPDKAKEGLNDLDEAYRKMIDSYALEDYYGHFHSWLKVFKKQQRYEPEKAVSAEKIRAFEEAVEEFQQTYEAEKAEAKKMPFSRHEAARVQKMPDEMQEDFSAPPEQRREN